MTIGNQFTVFGGYSVGVTPVLIPNTAVKSYSADDTALETMWESRSPPKLFEKASPDGEAFFVVCSATIILSGPASINVAG